jgi:hypothetical protein
MYLFGNAAIDGYSDGSLGWFIGCFIPEPFGLRHSAAIEVKWGVHNAGDTKRTSEHKTVGTTLTLLVSGSLVLEFPEINVSRTLDKPGDYAIFTPEIKHNWKSLTDSTVVTVRWPSQLSNT